MLYKNNEKELNMDLFENPTAEYRGAPFWAWNCELDEKELLWQIEQLKQMGFGGFYMHTRSGMATEYLSEDFMKLIKSCTRKAKSENMYAYLYDEDRWPSGAAGGFVTKTPEFRQRRLVFTLNKRECEPKEEALKTGKTYLLGIYDIILNERGELKKYRLIENENEATGIVRYAYIEVFSASNKAPGWYNGGTYVDTLSKNAVQRFVEITHEKYKEAVGDEFGETVPIIFTDEPQFNYNITLPSPTSKSDGFAPWTHDVGESFFEAFGYDITEKLPELFFEKENGEVSVARYNFHDHIAERFTTAFADTCGQWCENNNIYLTGHLAGEANLISQTICTGEALRFHRSLQIPGVDMLFNRREYITVKQAQSAVRQYAREGAMSECYGVTNWDFDFRGHKYQGDWQAAMGITMRVPHLSWVSMKGAAKRDYPASINYQSPWYKEYSYIENHYARLNTVLTRGEPCVSVGVIHPIESYWLHWGPESATFSMRKEMDARFDSIVQWMLFGNVDFDLISESTLPEIGKITNGKFGVGEMEYSVILVPACETLRSTTAELLEKFISAGGRVIFAGDMPKYMDAVPSERVRALYEQGEKVPFDKYMLTTALSNERIVDITDENGRNPEQFICQRRKDGETEYLFIANANPPLVNSLVPPHKYIHCNGNVPPCRATIKLKGEYEVSVLNTLTGKQEKISFKAEDGNTVVNYDFYENDSLLLKLALKDNAQCEAKKEEYDEISRITLMENVAFRRHEDNVCLLDLAEYAPDGGEFMETEEILRIDKRLREALSWPLASGQDMQPWAMEKEETTHYVTLRFTFRSEECFDNTHFCAEELAELFLNGDKVELKENGYFADKSIKRYHLPKLREGENVIIAKIPFAKEQSLEACYLTGDFGVRLSGCEKKLTKPENKIGFGDISNQDMPFYGGNISYIRKINIPQKCDLRINIAKYKGALTKVLIDGKDAGNIAFDPYELYISDVAAGEHTIEFVLFGNRHNTFGALHNCGISIYYGQNYWYSTDNSWSYEYNLKPVGILKSPVITMCKKKKL